MRGSLEAPKQIYNIESFSTADYSLLRVSVFLIKNKFDTFLFQVILLDFMKTLYS